MEVSATVRRLRIDRAGLDAVASLERAEIDCLLLKGPVTAQWLYAGEQRRYVDIDLLVAPDRFDDARAALAAVGFDAVTAVPVGGEIELVRSIDAATVDLHRRLKEIEATPEVQWSTFWARRVPFDWHGRSVAVLDTPTRVLHLCAHVLTSAATKDKPRADLLRGIERVGQEEWVAALEVADELGSRRTVALALALYGGDGGRRLARSLGVEARASAFERMRAVDTSGVLSMVRKVARSSPSDRRALVRGWLAPEPARLERRLQRHDVPHWLRDRPPSRVSMALLAPVLAVRAIRSLVRR